MRLVPRSLILAASLLLLSPSPAALQSQQPTSTVVKMADAPYVRLPAEMKAKPGRLTLIKAETNGKAIKWFCPGEADLLPYLDGSAIFSTPTVGRYRVYAYTALADVPSEPAMCIVIVGNAPPGPPDPPPDPIDPPNPPPNPLPSDKLQVMMIYESANTLTAKQRGVLDSTLVKHAITAAGGDWRVWDKDVDASGEPTFRKEAMKRPRTSLPWVIISSPKGFYEGGLPASVDDFIALLKKY